MDTSKTRSIKSLLLQAWRERWTDISWGIHIKSMLPRGVSGDVYDLADCILQQALVGPGPSNLFLSYLMHSLSSRIVSYGAVLSSIGRYQSFYKPYCILSLLDLLKTFQSRIGCHGNEEECIALCKAVVSVTHWLYSCILYSISKLTEQKQSPEHISMMEKSYEVLFYFSNSTFIKSLLYVGKFEDLGMYTQMLQKHKEFEYKITQVSTITISKEIMEGALNLVNSVDNFPMVLSEQVPKSNQNLQILASTVNIMISIDAVLYPTSDMAAFIDHLLLIKQLQDFSVPQLYCEIIRTALIGITNASCNTEDFRWFAFLFLKIRYLIAEIHSSLGSEGDLEKGLDMLLLYSPLLDLSDLKSDWNILTHLTTEFVKLGMLSDIQKRNLLTKRQNMAFKLPKPEQQQPNASLILKAELTNKSVLKTLQPETSYVNETLLGMLCHVIQKKNLELILSTLTACGQMHMFVSRLILLNDWCKFNNNETPKAALTRAIIFDVTFLLLCHICQYYGTEIVTGKNDIKDAFFVQWASECLMEGGKFKHPDLLLSHCQQNNVENLLAQFLEGEQEFKNHQAKWHDVVINAPAAAKEVLIAWQHGAFSTDKVKAILDYVKKQMCFVPVCISAWLCNYINVLHYGERLKPLNVLQQFLVPLQRESTNSPGESPSNNQVLHQPGNIYFNFRSSIMIGIINKMIHDLHPVTHKEYKNLGTVSPYGLTVRTPLAKILDEIFNSVHSKGWLDMKSLQYFDTLLYVGGARWLCESLIERLLNYRFMKDINRAVDMIVGIFYIDIEQCALALLLHVLPSYLYSESHEELMTEPYSIALSRLTVITTYAALQSRECSVAGNKVGCKRSHQELDIEDTKDMHEHCRPSKIHRSNAELLEDTPFKLQSLSDEHLRSAVANPINKAIADLMRTLLVIASDATISARSHFPIRFLEQVVLCAKEKVSAMLQFMPLGLVGLLFKKFPEEFSHELILAVSSMQSPRARKVAALSLCQLTIAQNRLTNKSQY